MKVKNYLNFIVGEMKCNSAVVGLVTNLVYDDHSAGLVRVLKKFLLT